MSNKPVWSKKSNGISISAWGDKDRLSYALRKTYQKDGAWVESKYFYASDLPVLLGLVLSAISQESIKAANEVESPAPPTPPEPPAQPYVRPPDDIPF